MVENKARIQNTEEKSFELRNRPLADRFKKISEGFKKCFLLIYIVLGNS